MKHKLSKRFLPLLAAVALVFGICSAASAESMTETDITSAAAVLLDLDSGTVLFQKGATEQLAPASTTKLLTIVTALDDGLQLSQEINISAVSASTSGSSMDLEEGEKVKAENLIRGMLLVSGNDAAMAVARQVGDTEEGFVEKMNAKAAEIGMSNSHFSNCTGIDADNHYTTAEDMAKLVKYIYDNYSYLIEYANMSTYALPATNMQSERTIVNRNLLVYNAEEVAASASPDELGDLTPDELADNESIESGTNPYYYEYATGLKTGTTNKAGNCIIATATKDGKNLAVCLLGDTSADGSSRWTEAKKLFEYGFTGFMSYTLSEIATLCGSTTTLTTGSVIIAPENGDSQKVTLPAGITAADITYTVTPSTGASAAVGSVVGTAEYKYQDTVIYSGNVVVTSVSGDPGASAGAEVSPSADATAPVSPINTVDVNENQDKKSGFPWIWVIIPVVIILAIVVRLLFVRSRRGRRYSRRRSRRGRRYKF